MRDGEQQREREIERGRGGERERERLCEEDEGPWIRNGSGLPEKSINHIPRIAIGGSYLGDL